MLEKILEDRSAEIEIDAVCGDIMNKKNKIYSDGSGDDSYYQLP